MDASGGVPGLDAYPSTYDFCKTIRDYEKSSPNEKLGMSKSGRIMSEGEFNKEYGKTNTLWGWTKSWGVTVRDHDQLSFEDYEHNLQVSLGNYVEKTRLAERGIDVVPIANLTSTGIKPLIVKLEQAPKTPFLPAARIYDRVNNQAVAALPSIKEGDYNNLMNFLEPQLKSALPSDFASDAAKRALFQEFCSISRRWVEELATRVSSPFKDTEQEKRLLELLVDDLVQRREKTGPKPEAQSLDLPDKEKLIVTEYVKGRPVETCKRTINFMDPPKTHGLSLDELQHLDYQVTCSAGQLEEELKENKTRAKAQGDSEPFRQEDHGEFQSLLDGEKQLGRCEYGYAYKTTSKELPTTGIAVADGNVGYGMEDVIVAQREHGMIAGQWVPVRVTAILDGHTEPTRELTGDNSAAVNSGRQLPHALVSRLGSMNRNILTRTGMVAACQSAVVDLDRQGMYKKGGSSINCAAVVGKHLCIINSGDSRAIYVNPKKALSEDGVFFQLSEDARLLSETDSPENAASRFNQMVHDRGGIVAPHPRKPEQVRVKSVDTPEDNPGMTCISSIGDHHYGGVTSPKPFVTVFEEGELDPDGFLIQFSDGISEVALNKQIARLVRLRCTENPDITQENLAANLRDHAFKARSGDNLAVIVTRVKDLFE